MFWLIKNEDKIVSAHLKLYFHYINKEQKLVVYVKVWISKNCLSRETNTIFSTFFVRWFEQIKSFSSFAKGAARWMFCIYLCPNHLIWAFAARILWKTRPWDIFAKVHTAKCIPSCNHDGSLEDYYCVLFFKLKFLISIWRHIFCLPKSSKI